MLYKLFLLLLLVRFFIIDVGFFRVYYMLITRIQLSDLTNDLNLVLSHLLKNSILRHKWRKAEFLRLSREEKIPVSSWVTTFFVPWISFWDEKQNKSLQTFWPATQLLRVLKDLKNQPEKNQIFTTISVLLSKNFPMVSVVTKKKCQIMILRHKK